VGVDEVLAASRTGVHRLTAHQAVSAAERGALLVDTRTEVQRRRQGELPRALGNDRTGQEWRRDPGSA
jgi:hypothetical protein